MTIRSLLTLGSAAIIFSLYACSDRTVATAKLPNDVATVGIQVKGSQRKMKVKEQLVAGAEVTPAPEVVAPLLDEGVKTIRSIATIGEQKELNFAGSRGNSMTAQYYR